MDNTRRMGDYCTFTSLNLPLLLFPPQPHTPKSCFCTVWRKPTTRSRCSSLTQGCPLCPTTQRSKFKCASVRRTRCTAALPTPTAPAFSCCSRHSCSPYSVSTIKTTTQRVKENLRWCFICRHLCLNMDKYWSNMAWFFQFWRGNNTDKAQNRRSLNFKFGGS